MSATFLHSTTTPFLNLPSSTNFTYYAIDAIEDDSHDYQKEELNLYYAICEVLVAVLAVVGNALVILVFRKERRLRRRTNYYIVSLAAADFLVGLLGIPFAIMASVGLPTNLYACLFTVSLLVVLCTISIFCLVAVSVDRYWAILHPMGYSRNVRTKTALVIISICWFAGTLIGFLPLMGWHKGPAENGRCFFLGVMDYNYLVFLYFGTIITPALLLAVFYAHIYHVVLRQLRQIVTINPYNGNSSSGNNNASRSTGGTMLRVLGAAQKREVKATKNLSIIVLFFMICWIPLYTINCIFAFCRDCKVNSTFVLSCIILSHLNSAGNPLLYAYHLKDFRAALKTFICGIFGIKVQQPNNTILKSNFTRYRLQSLREAHSTMSLSRSRFVCESQMRSLTLPLPTPNKISSLIGTSVATTTEPNHDIWRISEMSEEHHRQRRSITSLDDDGSNDDVFLPPSTHSATLNINLNLNLSTTNNTLAVSTSSTQLSRSLYLVEPSGEHNLAEFMCREREPNTEKPDPNFKSNLTITGDFIHSPAKSLKLSPFKAVSELLKTTTNGNKPPPRSFSLNEESDSVRHRNNNGYLPENHSYN